VREGVWKCEGKEKMREERREIKERGGWGEGGVERESEKMEE